MRAWVDNHRLRPADAQRAAAKDHGFTVHENGVEGLDRDFFIHWTRKGDTVCVCRLFILADPSIRLGAKRRADLLAAVQAIEAKGASIFEWETGRKSTKKQQRDAMMAEAYETIRLGNRVPSGRPRGRPTRKLSKRDLNRLIRYWRDVVAFETNQDALDALKADHGIDIPASTAYKLVKEATGKGKSGRKPRGK